MFEKTKNQSIWCDNGHEPFQMIYSHDSLLDNGSTYICSLCYAEKIVKASSGNGKISIEWVKKTIHTKLL